MEGKPTLALFPSYLSAIRNSVGTSLFRSLYFDIKGETIDVLEDGDLACASYVSGILLLFGLIKERHTTVNGTIEDMRASGWYDIPELREGAVLVWGFKKRDDGTQGKHRHLGFYINAELAISNSSDKRVIDEHHPTYGTFPSGEARRDIQFVLWNDRLNN